MIRPSFGSTATEIARACEVALPAGVYCFEAQGELPETQIGDEDLVRRDLDEGGCRRSPGEDAEDRLVVAEIGRSRGPVFDLRLTSGLELVEERPSPQLGRYVDLLGEILDPRVGARRVEERLVESERVEGVALVRGRPDLPRRPPFDGVALQTPEVEPDVRDVVAPSAGRNPPHLARVGGGARTGRRAAPSRRRREGRGARWRGGHVSRTASWRAAGRTRPPWRGQPVTS